MVGSGVVWMAFTHAVLDNACHGFGDGDRDRECFEPLGRAQLYE